MRVHKFKSLHSLARFLFPRAAYNFNRLLCDVWVDYFTVEKHTSKHKLFSVSTPVRKLFSLCSTTNLLKRYLNRSRKVLRCRPITMMSLQYSILIKIPLCNEKAEWAAYRSEDNLDGEKRIIKMFLEATGEVERLKSWRNGKRSANRKK